MKELDALREQLAKRCIEKSKEPMYVMDIKIIKNTLDKPINLSDVKKGDVIYIDCTRLPMEDVSRWPGMYDGRITDTSDSGMIKIKVQDIAELNGHYLIEYHGGMLTTLDFENEWKQQYERAKSIEATRIVQSAIDDIEHWFKPNIERFIEYFDINVSDVDKHSRKEFLNDMMDTVQKCIKEKGIQSPYGQLDRMEIMNAARDAVWEYKKNGLQKIREDMARKIVQLDKPLIYSASILEMESNDQSVNIRWDKLPKNLPFEMKGRFVPMTIADINEAKVHIEAEYLNFENLELEDVIRTKDGSVFFVTNVGIFTATNMAEEYREALIEAQKATELCFDQQNSVQRYLSIMTGEQSLLQHFDSSSATSYGNETKERQNIVNQSITRGARNFVQAALDRDMKIVLCDSSYAHCAIVGYEPHERDSHAVSPKRNYLSSIVPGQSIGLDVSATDILSNDDVQIANIKIDEIQSNGKDFIIVSSDTIYTTYEEIADIARDIYQNVEQSQEIGDR